MKERYEYIDALRGFAIFLVVMGHVWSFCIYSGMNNVELISTNSICNITNMFHVPLFFFISGFVFYKHNISWDFIGSVNFALNKFKSLIIPAIIFIVIYNAYYSHYDLLDIIRTNYKIGYWFTISLFEFLILHIAISIITGNKKKLSLTISASLGLFLYFIINLGGISSYYSNSYFKIFSCQQLQFLLFFECGIIAKYYLNRFLNMIENDIFITIVLISLFLSTYFVFYLHINLFSILIILSAIIISFKVFNYLQKVSFATTRYWRYFQFIGKHTLQIYFIHYFLLPYDLPKFYNSMVQSHTLIELYISVPITITIIIACLCIARIIQFSPFLDQILFGKTK